MDTKPLSIEMFGGCAALLVGVISLPILIVSGYSVIPGICLCFFGCSLIWTAYGAIEPGVPSEDANIAGYLGGCLMVLAGLSLLTAVIVVPIAAFYWWHPSIVASPSDRPEEKEREEVREYVRQCSNGTTTAAQRAQAVELIMAERERERKRTR